HEVGRLDADTVPLSNGTPQPLLVAAQLRQLTSRSNSFANLTPDNSVLGLGSRATNIDSQNESPNVSSNSSWTSTPSEPAPLERYLGMPDRREQIALSLPTSPRPFPECLPTGAAHKDTRSSAAE